VSLFSKPSGPASGPAAESAGSPQETPGGPLILSAGAGSARGRNGLLFGASFFFSFSGSVLSFSLVYLLTDRFGLNSGQVGTYLALGFLGYFLCCNLYHRFGTAVSPARIIPAATAVVLLSSLVLSQARSSLLAALAYMLVQGGTGFFWPPLMAWFTGGLDNKALNRDISIFNRSWMAGNLLGPPVSGALYHLSGGLSFLAANFSFALVLALLILVARREAAVRAPAAGGIQGPPEGEGQAGLSAAKDRRRPVPTVPLAQAREKALAWFRYRGWIGAFCTNCFAGVLSSIVPLHIRDGLGYTERTAGMVLFIRCVSGLAGFTVLARITFWHFNRRWFLLVQAVLVFCSFAFLPAGSMIPFYFVIIFVYGFVHSCCYNNSIFHSSATGRNPGKNLALHEMLLSIGSAVGSAGGGLFYQRFGFAGTFAALGIVQVLGLALFALLDYHDK
jgi:DHA1 family multidrug resistance protein-like MFS transporter/DHA1 family quinolone resistance protein-like MFS transporter